MECVFSALAQKLLADGTLRYMVSKTGEVLPVLVNSETNKIFEIGRLVGGLPPFQPVVAIIDGIGKIALSYQTHRGFQKTYRLIEGVQQSLGVLHNRDRGCRCRSYRSFNCCQSLSNAQITGRCSTTA